jgi:putative oxidoreductase
MLLKFLGKYRDAGLLLMRIGLGIAFMIHGLPKLTGGPKEWKPLGVAMGNIGVRQWPEVWGFLASVIEGVGGLLLVIGAFYRPVCLLMTFVMVMATLHLSSDAKTRDFNRGYSHPLKMAVVFLGLAFIGPGRYSVDGE